MEPRQRRTFSGRRGIEKGSNESLSEAAENEYRNRRKRAKYAADPAFAARLKDSRLRHYRATHPLPMLLANGLRVPGVQKYLYTEEDGVRYETNDAVESYSAPLAAQALGRTELTFKKWVRRRIIPSAIWRDTVRGFLQYTIGELEVIAAVIAEHEEKFVYLRPSDTDTIQAIWQAIHQYRATNI